jgi:hypothetical protein
MEQDDPVLARLAGGTKTTGADHVSTKLARGIETAGIGAAWGAIGTAVAGLGALLVPDAVLPDAVIAGIGGSLATALSVLGLLPKRFRPLSQLEGELRHADHLFLKGHITDVEYAALRAAILKKHTVG